MPTGRVAPPARPVGGKARPNADTEIVAPLSASAPQPQAHPLDCVGLIPFDFHISPNISMGRTGTVVIAALFAVPTVLLALIFFARGSWPVAIFAVLSLLGLFAALTFSRISLGRHERVFIRDQCVVVERTKASGASVSQSLPIYGIRLESIVDPDFGHLRLTLQHRARRMEIARDLSPAEREEFQAAFLDAMTTAGYAVPTRVVGCPAIYLPMLPMLHTPGGIFQRYYRRATACMHFCGMRISISPLRFSPWSCCMSQPPCSMHWFDAMACLKRWPPRCPPTRSRPSEIARYTLPPNAMVPRTTQVAHTPCDRPHPSACARTRARIIHCTTPPAGVQNERPAELVLAL
jgi:uncharacterized membrane protein